jgi:hypothetical protein
VFLATLFCDGGSSDKKNDQCAENSALRSPPQSGHRLMHQPLSGAGRLLVDPEAVRCMSLG